MKKIEDKFAVTPSNKQCFTLWKDVRDKVFLVSEQGVAYEYDAAVHDKYLTVVHADKFEWTEPGKFLYVVESETLAVDSVFVQETEREDITGGKWIDPASGVIYTLEVYGTNHHIVSSNPTPELQYVESNKIVCTHARRGSTLFRKLVNTEMSKTSEVYMRLIKP